MLCCGAQAAGSKSLSSAGAPCRAAAVPSYHPATYPGPTVSSRILPFRAALATMRGRAESKRARVSPALFRAESGSALPRSGSWWPGDRGTQRPVFVELPKPQFSVSLGSLFPQSTTHLFPSDFVYFFVFQTKQYHRPFRLPDSIKEAAFLFLCAFGTAW